MKIFTAVMYFASLLIVFVGGGVFVTYMRIKDSLDIWSEFTMLTNGLVMVALFMVFSMQYKILDNEGGYSD